MTCSICQQSGHNKQTCSVVVRYEYDDCGVKCRINPNDEGDFQPVETYCLPCGAKTEECDCGNYKCGKWFNEEKGKFQGAPRRSSPRRPRPTPEIKMKLACADCGQVETECHLEITEQGKTLCCDCLYPENQNDDADEGMEDCEDCGYTHHYEDKCPNEATAHHYEKWRVDEEDDDKTVSVVGDLCECCGRPYDDRNPLRQSEMCDCVQNDDGTLSRPEEVPELPCPDCRRWFDEGKDNCKSCDFDLNSFNKVEEEEEDSDDSWEPECCKCGTTTDTKGMGGVEHREDLCEWMCGRCYEYHTRSPRCYSPTRDQLIALGKYKLAKFQIGKSEQKDETNWNEDGDDELCSAIDASGNALY
jgi:hypothetical protein